MHLALVVTTPYINLGIYTDESFGTGIICGLDDQMKVFGSLDPFEVDMSYKQVKGAFMDREDPIAYKKMFPYAFELMESWEK
ncbi:hypothetical protein N7535_007719 [Penicillium sp. DV-2018c]|nr:hypothetical protein N7461_003750 [Penicillium sp. DV-2018c]KAJ5566081.1 hypothetical protein N7535_007719 [Penicillium sp. DV-2018c]